MIFQRISEREGMLGNQVKSLLLDSRGFLWIGTNIGLNRYDGYEFKTYQSDPNVPHTISANSINSIYESKAGLIWIGTETGGLNSFDPKTGLFTRYQYNQKDPGTISGDRVQCIAEDANGNIWVGLDDGAGICMLNTKSGVFTCFNPFKKYPHEVYGHYFEAIRDMTFNPSKPTELWLAAVLGLMRFNTETQEFQWYPHAVLQDGKSRPAGTWCLDWQDESNLRVGFYGLGTGVFNVEADKWTYKDNLDMRVLSLARKSETEFWVAARKKGIGILDITTNTYHFPKSDLILTHTPYPGYTSCVFSSGDRAWVGSKHGVTFIENRRLFSFHSLPFQNEELGRVLASSAKYGTMYVGGTVGAGLWEINQEVNVYLPEGRESITITRMVEYADRILLIEDYRRLLWFDKSTKQFSPFNYAIKTDTGKVSRMVNDAVYLVNDSILYLGSAYTGLSILNVHSGELAALSEDTSNPLSSVGAFDVELDGEGLFWIGSAEGVIVYDPQTNDIKRKELNSLKGMKSPRVHAVKRHPNGSMWLGSVNGLVIIDGEQETFLTSSNSRLPSDFLAEIQVDLFGNVWVGSDKGLSHITPKSLEIRNFDRSDGLDYAGMLAHLPDGDIMIGSYGGYTLVDPMEMLDRRDPGKVYLNNFKVFDEAYDLGVDVDFIKKIPLTYRENFFSFSFSKPEFSKPEKVSYAYRLLGFDTEWVNSGSRRYASYTNLDGGTYTFQVKARNADGLWTPVKSVDLIIEPPFWETWWFIVLCALVVGSVTYGFYRFRLAYLLREQRIKSEFERKIAEVEMTALRAQMNPHFLFNSLNSINSYIIKNKVHEATNYLAKFSKLIRLILQNSQQHLIPLRQEIDALRLYLELESIRFDEKFQYQVNIDEDLELEHIEVPPMIIQPYLENAIWHGLLHKKGNAVLLLNLLIENSYLIIEINDNGIGRKAAAERKSKSATKNKSLGMKITGDRLEVTKRLFGKDMQVQIIDKTDEMGIADGTLVRIKIPLDE